MKSRNTEYTNGPRESGVEVFTIEIGSENITREDAIRIAKEMVKGFDGDRLRARSMFVKAFEAQAGNDAFDYAMKYFGENETA